MALVTRPQCCGSSVVEHTLGKGEVESSILSHSTISLFEPENPPKYLKGKENSGVPYTPFMLYRNGSENANLSTVWRRAKSPFFHIFQGLDRNFRESSIQSSSRPFGGTVFSIRSESTIEAVEYATLEWVDWFNNRRLIEPVGNIPPAEAEANFYATLERTDMAA